MPRSQRLLYFDLETASIAAAGDYLEPVKPKKNLVDPVKIEEDIAEKERAQREDLALDWNLARVVCLGWAEDDQRDPIVYACRAEAEERQALAFFWTQWRYGTQFVGFYARRFDLPMLITRSRLLQVDIPSISLARYGKGDCTDLYEILTFEDQAGRAKCMREDLKTFCRRFDVAQDVEDGCDGAEVPQLVEAGAWDRIEQHCRADVLRTRGLAQRIGIGSPQPVSA